MDPSQVALIGFGIGALFAGFLTAYFMSIKSESSVASKIESLENDRIKLKYELNTLNQNFGGISALLASKQKELDEIYRQKEELSDTLQVEQENNRKILSMKKSSEIRTGNIAEQLAPLLMDTHETKGLKWLGQPIDYIAFDKDKITFIEVKSGKSHLSFNQKQIRKLVEEKKVFFEEFRIRGNKTKTR